jgi:PAS domain S-box-containing protein
MASVVAFEVGQLRQALGWVDHSDTVIAESRAVERGVVDAETGLRGFLITGRQEFLEPAQKTTSAAAHFSRLKELVSDNPVQKQRLTALLAKFQNWQDYAQEMIHLRESQGDYTDFERNLEGKRQMDDMRAEFGSVIQVEQALRDSRIQRANRLDKDFKWSLAALSLILVTTLVLFSRYQLRNLADQYDSALRTAENIAALERQRKQWFVTLLRSVGDAVIATDAEGLITFINPAAAAATGWSDEEARCQPLEKVFHVINADTREAIEDPVHKVRRMNAVVGLVNHTVLIRKDGGEINISDSGAPIRDDNGGIIGVILVFRDVTRQIELERTLRTTDRLALAGRITASVAHEIHNPLDTVGNLLYLIQNDASHLRTAEYAELASQELKRVNQVTRGMLSLYRESHAPVPVSLTDVLNGVLSMLEIQIKKKEAQVTCNSPHDATVEGFPGELHQLFTNLIDNALDAIPQRGQIAIECTSSDTQKDCCVTITDNGYGISSAYMDRLFQPLFTTKGENGTGLGLWVSKGIVEKHGGSIEAKNESALGTSGATFTVVLPQRFPVRTVLDKVSPA